MANNSNKSGRFVKRQDLTQVSTELKSFLLEKADRYESLDFIPDDPISIAHDFSDPNDIEVAAFLTATLAWGQRVTIKNNAAKWMSRMDNAPRQFLESASSDEMEAVSKGFVHRTFQPRDALFFMHALQCLLQEFDGLEAAFLPETFAEQRGESTRPHLEVFHDRFFAAALARGFEAGRTRKHVASPARGSATKRLNMFLRWMVRPSVRGVDFGIWTTIEPRQLMIPLDVHTGNVGRKLELLGRRASDWRAVEELMVGLRQVDPKDPVRMDFALFGLGAIEGF
ncbi:MAG: TIGR02757 family protein [Crocinitomicaceae bacterium]|nr:TIGR02757 family protein [Crocinitomicaceae bacterium]